uniref:Oxidoreductase n=1 Tax=Globisporangium ultimum (strain ATCC 200006 / CBS 805.95 / DAOM BR144) TaxID=431595 RepID=K3X2E3_GLOUD
MPMLADLRKKFFHGKSVDEDEKRQEKKRKIMVERARQKALDQQFINNTKLRAERLARLATLTAANPLLAQVPDGAISSEPLLLTDNVEMENMEATSTTTQEADAEDKSAVANVAAPEPELHHHRSCYTCKQKFKQLHHFYDRLCPPCAKLNYEKRLQTADLRDHVAIVTGARVKIGYEITLKLLRSGAMVIATTRFPKDAAYRFARERDFDAWKDKLQIYGMDFRDLGVIDKFMDHVATTFGSIDILINNATQTIRRPVHYYKHLIKSEVAPIPEELNGVEQILRGNASLLGIGAAETDSAPQAPTEGALIKARAASAIVAATDAATPSSVLLSQVVVVPEDQESEDAAHLFPEGQVDNNNQQVDLRSSNSWVQKIDQIETMELVEVFAINTMAPFILNKRAIPLLAKSANKHKFIINVSAMEGKFYRAKTPHHPHTNMAKAAANMMTRTAAEDLAKRGIFMNSVDTGWINDENPREVAARIATDHNFQTPLDEVDAAARVLDPIFMLHQEGHREPPLFGQFLKDFNISEW